MIRKQLWALQNKKTEEFFLAHSGHLNAIPQTYPSRVAARDVATVLCNEYKPIKISLTIRKAA